MKEYIPYAGLVVSILGLIATITKIVFDEKRARRKERLELLDKLNKAEYEKGTLPPRKETHLKR
ncbi:hypothetical protein MHB54_28010 [Paenibacillus sp. FSL M7-0802]|uniref:hypothetical protein n=1 Tax=Paenibacillus sp. FSL M7-0802 TaxID=2921536 RepID=UPI0030F663EC